MHVLHNLWDTGEFFIWAESSALPLISPFFSADLSRQHDRLGLCLSVTAGPPCVGLFDIPAVPGVFDHMSLIPCHKFSISILKSIK